MISLHDAIEYGVCNSRITDPGVPVFDGKLASDDGGAGAGTIVDDLQQVRACGTVDRPHAPVIKEQHVGLGELQQPFAEDAAAVTDAQFFL